MTRGAEEEETVMPQRNVWRGRTAAVMVLLILLGCATTSRRESPGDLREDAAMTAKVQASFAADPLLRASAITVETRRGVVSLTGTVKSEQERHRAIQLVQGVSGVREIIVRDLAVQR
jgi:osmotically-inducible protein OsmY